MTIPHSKVLRMLCLQIVSAAEAASFGYVFLTSCGKAVNGRANPLAGLQNFSNVSPAYLCGLSVVISIIFVIISIKWRKWFARRVICTLLFTGLLILQIFIPLRFPETCELALVCHLSIIVAFLQMPCSLLEGCMAPKKSRPPPISVSWFSFATKGEMDFLHSSFFTNSHHHRQLPTIENVRKRSHQNQSPQSQHNSAQPDPARFEEFGLIVKFGPHVKVEEALCLWAIRRALRDDVPVPEVYGWRRDGKEVFIYMELIQGATKLQDRWKALSNDDKTSVCYQLREMTTSFRTLEQDPRNSFVGKYPFLLLVMVANPSSPGSINHGPLQDYVLEGKPEGGPFASVRLFNDWFSQLPQDWLAPADRYEDPHRRDLPDNAAIKFTHGDLHTSNILVAQTGPPRILAIVDWAHGGWYPDYWEYCKAAYSQSSFEDKWLKKFLKPREKEHEAFSDICMAMGAV